MLGPQLHSIPISQHPPITTTTEDLKYHIGHEIYVSLCILDTLFKLDILDISTIRDHHDELKKYFRQYKQFPYPTTAISMHQNITMNPITDIHLRKHLEFIRNIQQPESRHFYYYNNTRTRRQDEIPVSVISAMKMIVKDMEVFLDMILDEVGYHNLIVDVYMV
ncbi:uncharacterized protein J8A68_003424 [[Candida] subhashii]|uniref:Uncharacterized protein n=1 Tax=[Candida] subhashii TaxID=561895 RepID=A0A8J5QH83_9ASCO|nr:uncharacterized protein J8A68_003424 [[Candida] subhashii]KAG7663042.1 hypothetical protein J8A68_003424 [[Candida] subhashii]